MLKKNWNIISFVLFTFLCILSYASPSNNYLVKKLFEKTLNEQYLEGRTFPFYEQQGSFRSAVKLYFYGKPEFRAFRDLFSVDDSNSFTTIWITTILLEAERYGQCTPIPEENLLSALKAIGKFHDHNSIYNTSAMTFWPQNYNSTTKTWISSPNNLLNMFKLVLDYLPTNLLHKVLDTLHLDDIWQQMNALINESGMFLTAFKIPPDFDDTGLNLGLLHLLKDRKGSLGYDVWLKDNTNASSIIKLIKTYAYRPLSSDRNVNTIDTRSYFYLRHFLSDSKKSGKDVALITTWVDDIATNRKIQAKGVGMPFNVNNVDMVVCANVIYGITSAALSNLEPVVHALKVDSDFAKIYINTSSMIAYVTKNNFTARPDLALTYYPSVYNYYWFLSRTAFLLENAKREGILYEPLSQVHSLLTDTLRASMTAVLHKNGKTSSDGMFYDDFMGNADTDIFGRPVEHHEDRLSTTSMAANALLHTWTYHNSTTKKLYWIGSTPAYVKDMVKDIYKWLEKYSLSGKYKPWNFFFSGSVKGVTDLTFWYPGNRYESLNGTKIPLSTNISSEVMYAMEGIIEEAEYNKMLEEKHFGMPTPIDFKTYNDPTYKPGGFPFWTSNAFSYASSLLAISQFNNLEEK